MWYQFVSIDICPRIYVTAVDCFEASVHAHTEMKVSIANDAYEGALPDVGVLFSFRVFSPHSSPQYKSRQHLERSLTTSSHVHVHRSHVHSLDVLEAMIRPPS